VGAIAASKAPVDALGNPLDHCQIETPPA
jgi:hypothetical protein